MKSNNALDCEYEYPGGVDLTELKKDGDNYITCTCSDVTSNYYTLLNDLTRLQYNPYVPQNTTHESLLIIQLFLIVFGILMPCVMIVLDSTDYQNVEDNVYPVDDLTIAQLELARNALCKQEVYYREMEIAKYMQLDANEFRSGSGVAFMTFHRTLHPLFSLFTHFDYRKKRVTRFAFLLGQISTITILLWLFYSQPATEMIEDMTGITPEIWI